ncbi:hypothetical protein Dimus_025753 [Dionaea muscipula]
MTIGEENVKEILSGWRLPAKPCDSCNTAAALLFCRADSAFLCGACDSKVHAANKLASRHDRVWMCEVCEQAPAAVTCKADAAALCVSCDHDIHSANPLARRHQRLPVVPFFAAAHALTKSSSSTSSSPEEDDTNNKDTNSNSNNQAGGDDDAADAWLIPNPGGSKLTADFLYSDMDPLLDFNYTAPNLDIKPQDHHRDVNSGAGDGVVPNFTNGSLNFSLNHHPQDNYFDVDFPKSKIYRSNYSTQRISHSVSSSDVGVVPDGNSSSIPEVSNCAFPKAIGADAGAQPAAPPQQLSKEDREARVLRYREKRKNRKFEKTIRYASRKAYAETRPRIKGRFAKRAEMEGDVDQVFGGGAGGYLMADHGGFGVVPTF